MILKPFPFLGEFREVRVGKQIPFRGIYLLNEKIDIGKKKTKPVIVETVKEMCVCVCVIIL